jgi:hypothetical protein
VENGGQTLEAVQRQRFHGPLIVSLIIASNFADRLRGLQACDFSSPRNLGSNVILRSRYQNSRVRNVQKLRNNFFFWRSTVNGCGLEDSSKLEEAPLESPTDAVSPRGFSVVDPRTGLRQPNLKLGFTLPFQTVPLQQSSPFILHSLLDFVIAVLWLYSRCCRCCRDYCSCHRSAY